MNNAGPYAGMYTRIGPAAGPIRPAVPDSTVSGLFAAYGLADAGYAVCSMRPGQVYPGSWGQPQLIACGITPLNEAIACEYDRGILQAKQSQGITVYYQQ